MGRTSRRGVLLGGVAATLAGCSASPGSSDSGRSATSTATPPSTAPATTTPSPTPQGTQPPPPAVHRWRPDPNELSPIAKLTAVRRIEADGNGPDAALQVIDAQYGGLLTDSASVLVVTRSWRRNGSDIVPGGHTFDVRLTRAGTRWRITATYPSAPGAPAARLTSAARHVLGSGRIVLPPAGAADVRSGLVHDSVLHAMLAMSTTYRIHVSVVRSGHPIHVFGTDRLSDHPQGRAFDTWAIDGHPVVARSTPRFLVENYMHAAAAAGSYNVGGPYLLGAAPQWFSDDTHHDHVHAGFLT